MAGGFAGGISEVLSGKKNLSKGIKVEVEDKEAKIDVNIIVEYGVRIPDVAFQIQNRVKKAVETMTGLIVTAVNIHVQGVNTPDNKEQTENRKKFKKTEAEYVYYENHHIIPKCLNGTNNEDNLVLLTAREHFICHKLLTYIYPTNRKIVLAFHKMTFGNHHDKYNLTSKDYSYARELISKIPMTTETKIKIGLAIKNRYLTNGCSSETRKKLSQSLKGRIAPNKGRPMSEIQKHKLSLALKEKTKIISDETRRKMSESAKKKPKVSIETRKKMSEKRRGKLNPMANKLGKNNPNFGSKRSEETKQKMKKPKSNTDKMKGNKNALGYRHTDEAKLRISAALKLRKGNL
jgi:uncharacterized alkaline shock family protein YloU